MTSLRIDGVSIPIAERFITPDMEDTLNFYPHYCRFVEDSGNNPVPFQQFLLRVCKHLETHRDETDEPDVTNWLLKYFDHYGLADFGRRLGLSDQSIADMERVDIARIMNRLNAAERE